ncbi:hypothetical protein HanPSC8_Chr17g0761841 [Helianthus annuus]|nr:hypothetical protein HanPSC8_Chr17g0761841 [Helianthus annuus]
MEPSTEYVAFEEKVKKTIYIEQLIPSGHESRFKKMPINQFGNVKDVSSFPRIRVLRCLCCAGWRWNQPNRLKKSSVRWVILLL